MRATSLGLQTAVHPALKFLGSPRISRKYGQKFRNAMRCHPWHAICSDTICSDKSRRVARGGYLEFQIFFKTRIKNSRASATVVARDRWSHQGGVPGKQGLPARSRLGPR